MIIFFNGGSDENPYFLKAIHHFKNHHFNVLLISTLAPRRFTYNQIKCLMVPLSKILAGSVLLHDIFGTHFDFQRRTLNLELEKRNFKKKMVKFWLKCEINL